MSTKPTREEINQRTKAAVIPDDLEVLLDEFQTAKLQNCSVHTLRRDRWAGGGIPFIKLSNNGMVRYRRADINAHLESKLCRSTSEYTQPAARKAGPGRPKKQQPTAA